MFIEWMMQNGAQTDCNKLDPCMLAHVDMLCAHFAGGHKSLRRTCVQLVSQIALHDYSLHVRGKTYKPHCMEPKWEPSLNGIEWHPRTTSCPAEFPFAGVLALQFWGFRPIGSTVSRRPPAFVVCHVELLDHSEGFFGTCTVDDNEAGSLRH